MTRWSMHSCKMMLDWVITQSTRNLSSQTETFWPIDGFRKLHSSMKISLKTAMTIVSKSRIRKAPIPRSLKIGIRCANLAQIITPKTTSKWMRITIKRSPQRHPTLHVILCIRRWVQHSMKDLLPLAQVIRIYPWTDSLWLHALSPELVSSRLMQMW